MPKSKRCRSRSLHRDSAIIAELRHKMRIWRYDVLPGRHHARTQDYALRGSHAVAASNFADARSDTRKMTCEQTQALIQSQHAAVLSTGPNTYHRYVRQFGNECDAPYAPMADYVFRPAPAGAWFTGARSRLQWFRIDRRPVSSPGFSREPQTLADAAYLTF
ncbi:hypothetical protein LB520_02115 [Mesorhizobium sp. CA12]|nr:hypothetical protein [Mesorhizobium sp. CA12]